MLAETKDIHALLADTGGKAGKVAVGGHEAKSIEPAAVQKIHGIDDQRDV